MRILVLGAGNLLLSDEGFGVHFIRYLERHCDLPAEVELLDAGTLGLMVSHKLEEADCVYIVDVVTAAGLPGTLVRYSGTEFSLQRLPIKLSPHQIGIQEMLLVSQLRNRCPADVQLLGVVPSCIEPGTELSPALSQRLPEIACQLVQELKGRLGCRKSSDQGVQR
jgi:hydrogenase maturation protease